MTQRRILIVDDQPDIAESFKALVEDMGHLGLVVTSGTTAVQATQEWRPDIVLLDIGLPDSDGYSVAESIREKGADVRIVVVSGYPEDDGVCSLAGGLFDSWIQKPLSREDLVLLLND